MLENNRLNDLLQRFPADVQLIFQHMISAYQLGYVDYVYQTRDYAVQERRIKNLAKNFRKMNYFYVMPLSQDLAVEIAGQWFNQAPYNCSSWNSHKTQQTELLSPLLREDRYFAVIHNAALMGYFCLEKGQKENWITLGLQPALIGKGKGKTLYQTIEDYLKTEKKLTTVCVSINPQHLAALKLFQAVGFTTLSDSYEQTKIIMKKEWECD